jgi:peptidase M28-like protein
MSPARLLALTAGLSLGVPLGATLAHSATGNTAPVTSKAATQWWADITALAGDDTEGRQTGSAAYLRAADYVIRRFKSIGLLPAGTQGFLQAVAMERQTVDQQASTADLVNADGTETALKPGTDSRISPGGAPAADRVDAPLVFIGYGLHLPDQGYDDFEGVDLKGKIAVVISGGPETISGAVKSNAHFGQTKLLGKLGAVGLIALTTPHQVEIPWARQIALAAQPGMYLAAAELRNTPDGFLAVAVDPARSEALFTGSGHSFAELCALADAGKPQPRFALPFRLRAHVVATRESLSSPNLVAKLPGRDPKLAAQYVAVSAHLDHLGIGTPINGDTIYNGAMDDASGVATVLDIATRLKKGQRPRRSILFLVFTAEEKGLLGSHYYARNPTIPKGGLVADLNFDMALPLWPLTSVYAPGEAESTLAADARAIAAARGLTMAPDPLPERNVFIRTDQFSFVREGIPALAFKFGFAKGTPQFDIEHEWRANRYHSPSDDL